MLSIDEASGRTYSWNGNLEPDTRITVTDPDGETAVRTFGALMGQSNGAILEVLEG